MLKKKGSYIKECKMCHKMKSLSNYYVDRNAGDKLDEFCKKCRDKMKS